MLVELKISNENQTILEANETSLQIIFLTAAYFWRSFRMKGLKQKMFLLLIFPNTSVSRI